MELQMSCYKYVVPCVVLTVLIGSAHAEIPTELEEVVVTGARTSNSVGVGVLGERPILDTPLSVTGYTADMILDQGARSTSEVLANDPSIRLQGAGDGNYDYFTIRGFSLSASAFALNGLYGVLPWNTLSPEAVQQFEVIRGPATTYTGASPFDNPGGAVNIQPKRAGDKPLTRITATYDAGGQVGAHADVGRRFGSDAFGVRINAMIRDGELAREHQDEKVELLTVGLDHRSDATRISLDAGYQKLRTDGATFLYHLYDVTQPLPTAPETDHNTSPHWVNAESRDKYVAVRGEFDITAHTLLYAALGTRDHHSSIVNPYDEIQDGAGNLHAYPYQEAYFAKTHWSAESGVRTEFETGAVNHRLIVSASGIDFDTGWLGTYSDGFTGLPEYDSNLYAPFLPPKPDLSGAATNPQTQLRNKLIGAALVDTVSFAGGQYQATLGVRRQNYKIERLYEVEQRHYDESAWAPSVALLVKLTPEFSVYANFVTGLSQGPFAPVGTDNENTAFPPGKSTQYEAGVKWQRGRFFTSAALFQITQPAGLVDSDTNLFSINGEQRHRGVEWTFSGDVTRSVRVLGGVNYLDAQLTRTARGELDGQTAPGVPALSANLSGEWDMRLLSGLTFTARALYTGKQYVADDNLQSIPAWTRYDLGARYRTELARSMLTLRLNAINVTGKDYWASAKGFGLMLGAPRSLLLSASVDF
jgi:iron complex outermembrane recepter protein